MRIIQFITTLVYEATQIELYALSYFSYKINRINDKGPKSLPKWWKQIIYMYDMLQETKHTQHDMHLLAIENLKWGYSS